MNPTRLSCCCCRLLHPFMPFVTEELWQRLPRGPQQAQQAEQQQRPASIMVADYPSQQPAWEDPRAEADMAYILTVVNRWARVRCGSLVGGGEALGTCLVTTAVGWNVCD